MRAGFVWLGLWIAVGFALPLRASEPSGASAPGDDKLSISFGGFVDTDYLYDFNRPAGLDRALTSGNLYATTGERSNEFGINLAFLEAKVSADRIRGRFALQLGNSVQANYRSENAGLGVVQGPFPAELIQEAVVGYRIADGLWVDAGIFFSHLGFESFISRDNWVYTRSLIAELSPYYESGVKLSYQASPQWSAQLLVVNGWQNIFETNAGKSVGVAVSYTPSESLTLTYNDYFGDESTGLARLFNELIARVSLSSTVQLALTLDLGAQSKSAGPGTSTWYGGALLARWQLTPMLAFGGRLERFSDTDGIVVVAGTPHGFAVSGASINFDVPLHKSLLWRNEARLLVSDQDSVFVGANGPLPTDSFLVSSLGLSF